MGRFEVMVEKYEQGETLQNIADLFGISKQRVSMIFKKNNIKSRHPGRKAELLSKIKSNISIIKNWVDEGFSIMEISRRLNICNTSLSIYLHKLGIEKDKTKKRCPRCSIVKPLEDFSSSRVYCKRCRTAITIKNYRKKHKEVHIRKSKYFNEDEKAILARNKS